MVKSSYLVLITVLFGNLLLSLNLTAETELYQWVDENGVRHFSQQPPAHIPDLQAVDIHGAPVISGGEPRPLAVAQESSEQEESEPKEQEIERIENPEKDPERCAKARKNINVYQGSPRVRVKDPETGEFRFLGEEERATQLKNWQDREKTFC